MTKRRIHSLKSFTLLELLVSMLISGVVISASIAAYAIVSSQFSQYRKINGRLQEAQMLHSLLQYDAGKSERIWRDAEGFQFVSPEGTSVNYIFNEKDVWRKVGLVTDTFHFEIDNLVATYNEEEEREGMITQIRFESVIFDEREYFLVQKTYDAQEMMEKENNTR